MTEKTQARTEFAQAQAFIDKVGKSQRTTLPSLGHLHSIETKTTIYFQETDGAKNYHECGAFDRAFAAVVRRHWGRLLDETMVLLQQRATAEVAANLDFYREKVKEAEIAAAGLLLTTAGVNTDE